MRLEITTANYVVVHRYRVLSTRRAIAKTCQAIVLLSAMSVIPGCSDTAGPSGPTQPPPPLGPIRLTIRVQPSGGEVAKPFSRQPVVEVRDRAGNVVSTDNSTVVSVAIATGTGTLLGITESTVVRGAAHFADLAIDGAPGEFALRFAAQGLESAVSDFFGLKPVSGLLNPDDALIRSVAAGVFLVPNQLMVLVERGTSIGVLVNAAENVGGSLVSTVPLTETAPFDAYQMEVPAASADELDGIIRRLGNETAILAALEQLLIAPAGHLDNDRPEANSNDQLWAYHRVRLSEAWHRIPPDRSLRSVRVGIIDSGIDADHPEFRSVQLEGQNYTPREDPSEWDEDSDGHGTLVAGIIGAANDGSGFNGILGPASGGYTLRVFRVRLQDFPGCGRCFATHALIWALIDAAFDNLDVVNLSWGMESSNSAARQENRDFLSLLAEKAPGTVFVGAAGNNSGDGADAWPVNDLATFLVVGGTDRQDGRWNSACGGSSFGAISLAAPAEPVYTTKPESQLHPLDTRYASCCGTSCSAPLVSGAAAFLRQLGVPANRVKEILVRTADDIVVDVGPWKRLNLLRAVEDVLGPATMSVLLTADPASGAAPLSTTLTATVEGSATGTVNYTFWWDCGDPGASVADVSMACGDPTDPAVGAKIDGVDATSWSVENTYSSAGDFAAKVIAERGSASPAESSVSVSVSAPSVGLWSMVSAGSDHTCGVTADNAAYCWGANYASQLGNEEVSSSGGVAETPHRVAINLPVSSVSAGYVHSCAITTSGAAYCWGADLFPSGQLGNDLIQQSSTPVAVSGGLTFTSISAGSFHTCGLSNNGVAYCWGSNSKGQLGSGELDLFGDPARSFVPVPVTGGLTFTSLSASHLHTCGVAADGKAYCWGANGSGQLGDGTFTDRATPTPAAGNLAFVSIEAGAFHTCAVASGGQAYCWGDNDDGELGDGTSALRTTPVAVSGGIAFTSISASDWIDALANSVFERHTCGTDTSGAAYCWGANSFGQLGNGSVIPASTPRQVTGALSFVAVSTGGTHSCGITNQGDAYCWGDGLFGALGDGSGADSSTPVRVRDPQ